MAMKALLAASVAACVASASVADALRAPARVLSSTPKLVPRVTVQEPPRRSVRSSPVSALPLLAAAVTACPLLLRAHPAWASTTGLVSESTLKMLADSAFFQALSLIFVSELGDKTFFIATLLAARTSRLLTFVGAAGALTVMTVFSVLIGQIFHAVPTGLTGGLPIDDIVAVGSFSYFGLRSLRDAASSDEGGMEDEREEAEEELEKAGVARGRWAVIGEAFTLTAAAELGDRSQLTTIALSAAQNPVGVCLGAIVAHCIATGGAVLGGSFISKYLSERVIGCAARCSRWRRGGQ